MRLGRTAAKTKEPSEDIVQRKNPLAGISAPVPAASITARGIVDCTTQTSADTFLNALRHTAAAE
jgi:hypothetical protein